MGKIAILLGVTFGVASFKGNYNLYFQENVTENSFAFGNSVGLIEVGIATNIQSLKYRLFFMIAQLVVKFITIQGAYVQVPVSGVGLIGTTIFVICLFLMQEILARKDFNVRFQSQEKLRKFQSLLSKDFPIGVLIMSTDGSTVLYSNQFFKNTFEEDETQIKERVFRNFELESDPEALGIMNSPLQTLTLFEYVESFCPKKLSKQDQDMVVLPALYKHFNSDTESHYEIKLRLITWDHQPAYALIFNDVSEKQLVTALKLADQEKDRIIATVSHELRTPINGTLGLLKMIQDRTADEISQNYLKYCQSCNKLLLYLVNSILDLSQIKQHTLKLIKDIFVLDELLEELRSIYLYQCQDKGIDFIIKKSDAVPKRIFTDRHRLIEILINLVGNAIKFTFEGSVTLTIDVDKRDPRKLKFSVIDTGIGIREQDKIKLFQKFGKLQQENNNVNRYGVGLGLAIVQELVAAMNNDDKEEKAWFESEFEKGSVFSFRLLYKIEIEIKSLSDVKEAEGENNAIFPKEYDTSDKTITEKFQKYESLMGRNDNYKTFLSCDSFPLVKAKSQEKSTAEDSLLPKKKVKLNHVLIVDDNSFNILAASTILEKFKCQIDKAFNGQECLNLMMDNALLGKHYDLVLMDIQMPVMDGPQASLMIAERIRHGELKYTPVIALTAKKSTKEDLEYYKECGIKAVIEKPLNKEELLEIIRLHVLDS